MPKAESALVNLSPQVLGLENLVYFIVFTALHCNDQTSYKSAHLFSITTYQEAKRMTQIEGLKTTGKPGSCRILTTRLGLSYTRPHTLIYIVSMSFGCEPLEAPIVQSPDFKPGVHLHTFASMCKIGWFMLGSAKYIF